MDRKIEPSVIKLLERWNKMSKVTKRHKNDFELGPYKFYGAYLIDMDFEDSSGLVHNFNLKICFDKVEEKE